MQSVNEGQERVNPQWVELLRKAVDEPGKLLEAYSLFHSYSLGNCMAAACQCDQRGLRLGPVNTFMGWKALGRSVKKGERAIMLCMPLTAKRKDAAGPDSEGQEFIRCFVWRPNWVVLAQTEGADYQAKSVTGTWDKAAALRNLSIEEVPFDHPDGNCQGFARNRTVAVSPLAQLSHKTMFHELAHVVLGHTLQDECSDSAILPRALREVESESVAMLLCETLELPGCEYCRGYIQSWWSHEAIPEQSAQRIFCAAHKILSAGTVEQDTISDGKGERDEPDH